MSLSHQSCQTCIRYSISLFHSHSFILILTILPLTLSQSPIYTHSLSNSPHRSRCYKISLRSHHILHIIPIPIPPPPALRSANTATACTF